jgi:internalin A
MFKLFSRLKAKAPDPSPQATIPTSLADARIQKARENRATTLDLSNLGLTELPESVTQLSQLQVLYINDNDLTTLPESVAQLSQLDTLYLDGNKLTVFPESLTKLSRLSRLHLNNNQLETLPESIAQLSELQVLYLERNKLTMLPESITQLSQLRWLYLEDNRLATLPESVTQLSRLQALRLSFNQLTTLPESVAQLSQLQALYLDRNQLTALPEALRKLTRLGGLFLHGNDALGLPAEVLGAEWREGSTPAKPAAILDYYFRTRGRPRPLNEAKLILVGRGAVGKTSIANRLIHDTFEDVKKTEGIRITEWPLTVGEKRDQVRLNVWDFGGQEIMHATHQFFLTARSLYLLVLSGREGVEDADAEYWLKLIQSFGGGSPVVIVLNKTKEHPFDVNRNALLRKYPFIREFVKTDCEDATGIEELRRTIERETDRLEHLRDAFPASWFSIKDRLAGMRRNYLSFEEYRRECAELGEKDPEAQNSLAFHLHNLGIALNYSEDPRLKETHVLNPHWVTSGIYKILNANRLEKQKGEISLKDLSAILDLREYPKKMHGFLLDLMKKFELCFDLEGRDGVYLIPELLDKQQPEEAAEFGPAECLNFQYHYPVLPEGLLPRFVVRTHVLSDETQRWRTGVVLKLEDNLALVRADAQERRVLINIKGSVAGRRRLLSVIRANFDRIHGSIKNLKPAEIVPLPRQPDAHVPYVELLAWEQSGKREFEKVVDGDIVTLDVQRLLNGVELEGERASKHRLIASGTLVGTYIERERAARVFVSYSHRDERQLNELKTHLSPLERLKLIETWYDRRIVAGEDFGQKVNENINSADIILLLISADFIASKYCYEIEMKRALERHEEDETRVVPVIVRDVNWKVIPELSKLTAVPKDGKPVPKWPTKDEAWRDVSERVQKILEAMRDADPLRRRAR